MSVRGTRHRQFRCDDDLWERAMAKARRLELEDGVSGVLRDRLQEWADAPDPDPEPAVAGEG